MTWTTRTPLARSPMSRGTSSLKRSAMAKGKGKKTRANRAANAKLKAEFEKQGITSCELGYPGCTRDEFLSWAHGKKRRKLQGDELVTLVILACINCHNRIEYTGHEAMLAIVESVIAERGWQVSNEVGK